MRTVIGLMLGAVILGIGVRLTRFEASAKTAALTAQDYLDIQNLYGTYVRFLDMGGGGDGGDFVNVFTPSGETSVVTPDGQFNTVKGEDGLKKMVTDYHHRLQTEGWSSRHVYSGLVITPTPEGAKGSVYSLTFNVTAEPAFVARSGVYEDWLVKSKGAWKFQKRIYRSSESFKPSRRQGMDEIFTTSR